MDRYQDISAEISVITPIDPLVETDKLELKWTRFEKLNVFPLNRV
jgi:hypothetical protein